MPAPWQMSTISLPSKRKMTNYGAPRGQAPREPLCLCYDSHPHNSNLCRWGKLYTICCKIGRQSKQTLAHVLSHCQAAIQHGRYNAQHYRILEILFKHLQLHLPPGTKVVADLAGQPYTLPTSLLMDLRPDLLIHSPGQLHFLDLAVCLEANFMSAKLRKETKYLHLLKQACSVGTQVTLSMIQVGCRGFIDSKSLHHLFALEPTNIEVYTEVTNQPNHQTVSEESHAIWSLRN